MLAEKLCSWIQRTRPRDLHDIATIVHSQSIPICIPHILSTFLHKTIFKQVPLSGREEMLFPGTFDLVAEHWDRAMLIPPAQQRNAAASIATFHQFIEALYDPAVLAEIGVAAADPALYLYNIESGVRETLISAGRAHKMVRIRYNDQERDIEPYSFRYKVTKKGVGAEYFYGFDRSRGETIKSFILRVARSTIDQAGGFVGSTTLTAVSRRSSSATAWAFFAPARSASADPSAPLEAASARKPHNRVFHRHLRLLAEFLQLLLDGGSLCRKIGADRLRQEPGVRLERLKLLGRVVDVLLSLATKLRGPTVQAPLGFAQAIFDAQERRFQTFAEVDDSLAHCALLLAWRTITQLSVAVLRRINLTGRPCAQ